MQYMNILLQTKLHSAFEVLQLQTFQALLAPLLQGWFEGWFEVFSRERNISHSSRALAGMTPETFIFILNTVGPGLAKENTQLRDNVSYPFLTRQFKNSNLI